jgi:hypothetical protein
MCVKSGFVRKVECCTNSVDCRIPVIRIVSVLGGCW